MLSVEEKERLYGFIVAVIGEDSSIKAYQSSFNERTVEVVEGMIERNKTCNANMKKLVTDLMSGSSFFTKGWLRKLIKKSKKSVSKAEFKGLGCLVATKSAFKNAIIASTI